VSGAALGDESPGEEWKQAVQQRLDDARVILLLISVRL
jgi:hypothetical protein